MIERELKENDEVLINDIDENEFLYRGREKKIKRLILLSIILSVIIGIIIIIVVASKKSEDDIKDVSPDDISDKSSGDNSDTASDDISDKTSDDISDTPSDDISDTSTDEISDASIDDISDSTSDDISDIPSDDISDIPSDDISDKPSDDSSDTTSDDISDDTKEKELNILIKDSNFEKPNNFLKQYEFIQLKDSKYKFFLVHDPKTVTAGIEFRTKFGYTTDIIDGFAHYAENVFFEGTEEINEYNISSLVDQYDEFNDAYTSYEETVFQFYGAQNTFNTILDYISKFIENPALNETKFMTAINVITSEHYSYNNSKKIKYDILMENANPDHGFSQTTTGHIGDNKTLGIYSPKLLGEYLKNYFRTIFKPENCVFLLYSSLSLEEMRNYTLKYFNFILENPSDEFNNIFNKKIEALDNPIYTKEQLGKFVVYNALREIPILMVEF